MNLEAEITRYSKLNESPISSYKDISCACGFKKFRLYSDDVEGGAYLTCCTCDSEIELLNSKKYIEKEFQNICNCGNEKFGIAVGISTHQNSEDINWVYIGAGCDQCGLAGVYVDWKER